MPPKKPRGMEMTSAQGQEMTRKISARWIQMPHASLEQQGRQYGQQNRRHHHERGCRYARTG